MLKLLPKIMVKLCKLTSKKTRKRLKSLLSVAQHWQIQLLLKAKSLYSQKAQRVCFLSIAHKRYGSLTRNLKISSVSHLSRLSSLAARTLTQVLEFTLVLMTLTLPLVLCSILLFKITTHSLQMASMCQTWMLLILNAHLCLMRMIKTKI